MMLQLKSSQSVPAVYLKVMVCEGLLSYLSELSTDVERKSARCRKHEGALNVAAGRFGEALYLWLVHVLWLQCRSGVLQRVIIVR